MVRVADHPRVRTYAARRRVSPLTRERLATLGPLWSLPPGPLRPAAAFGRQVPLVVDIGCGHGEAAIAYAVSHPAHDIVAVDTHTPGIARLLAAAEASGAAGSPAAGEAPGAPGRSAVASTLASTAVSTPVSTGASTAGARPARAATGAGPAASGVPNLRIELADAVAFLEERVGVAILDAAHLFFPDPWPKARHAKRRLVSGRLLELLTSRLKPGGHLLLATDDPGYAAYAIAQVRAHGALMPVRAGRPCWRPCGGFEARAMARSREVIEIRAERP